MTSQGAAASAAGETDWNASGVSCVGGGSIQGDVVRSENTLADRMTANGPPADADLGLNSTASEVLQQPLQRLRELDRLELARQREEVQSVRGELRNVPPGQHARYREEQDAQHELKRALRELLERTDEQDRFTLETLLRAVEAGQRDWSGGSIVREACADGRQQLACRGDAAQGGVQGKILVALVVASLAITARKLRLGGRLLKACGVVKHWWHLLWCRHLAEFISMAESKQHLAVGTAKQLLTGLSPKADAAPSLSSSKSVSESGPPDVFGYNTDINRERRRWLRPWRWFTRRGRPAAEVSPPPPLAPPAGLPASGGSPPAKAALYGMTSSNSRMPVLPPRQRHSLDPSAFSTLHRNWQQARVPVVNPVQHRRTAEEVGPAAWRQASAEAGSQREGGFSFRTYVDHDPMLAELRTSCSEGDLATALGHFTSESDTYPDSSRTQDPDAFSFDCRSSTSCMKADFLTARTTSFREWQEFSSQPDMKSSCCASLKPGATPASSERIHDAAVAPVVKVPALSTDEMYALPRSVSADALAQGAGGVSFRTLVENAADLPSPARVMQSANKAHAHSMLTEQEVF